VKILKRGLFGKITQCLSLSKIVWPIYNLWVYNNVGNL